MNKKQDFYCENCFENENIKQFIRKYGEPLKKEFECSYCRNENYICESDIFDCIQEYIDNECMVKKRKKAGSQEEFEDYLEDYLDECEKECQEKYEEKCKQENIEPIYIIDQKTFIQKLRKVIENLYSYDWDNNYDEMLHTANKYYVEDENESPEQFADLISLSQLEGIEDKPEYGFSALEDVLHTIGIDDITENFEDVFNEYILTKAEIREHHKYGEYLKDFEIFSNNRPWKDNCLYTDEYRFILWKNFAKNVKHKARYFDHTGFSVVEALNEFNEFFEKAIISIEKPIYRARLIDSDKTENDIKINPEQELGKTPEECAKNNRFSPVGISYGYFAFDKETALAETRASKGDKFGIGEFSLSLNLKLVDFRQNSISKLTNPFLDTFDIRSYCASFTIKKFIEDISKPISDKDSLLEYVPTQVMAEYIWHKGYDGFIFDSSQKSGGENIVIFGENPAYKSYSIVEIKEVNLEFDEV